jgi:DNA polymerase I-like protein with 3'-5' exonuclease and polymerase domains
VALFDLGSRSNKSTDSKIAKKLKSKPSKSGAVHLTGGSSLLDLIKTSVALAEKHLAKYKDSYDVIRTEEQLKNYIDCILENGIYAIDTETTGLDPITNTIAGFSMFTPGQKAVYVPLNHVSYITMVKTKDQIEMDIAREQLNRLVDVPAVTFNGKFDYRVIKNQLGVKIKVYFDCYLAGKLLNENERDAGLKALHAKYCLKGNSAVSFKDLFEGVPFTQVPINTGYLYAARDAEITYELYEFQKQFLKLDAERDDLRRVAEVFWNIEMPIVTIVGDTEDTGVTLDLDYCEQLSEKYHKLLDEKLKRFYDICDMYKDEIESYKIRTRDTILGNPINVASNKQIAVLLYDILKLKNKNKNNPRGTGEEILVTIDHDICKAILEYRGVAKLLSTYIDKMPNELNSKTGRIHCKFNQYGAVTGRFSSSEPNMQNIPSHNNDIRKMFIADEGMYMLSCDYSAQEPRLTAQMCQGEKMIKAYKEGKDLYCEIASIAFGVPYEECMEFRPDGTKNPEGKERRGQAKTIVLGVCYGRQIDSIAEQLGTTRNEAEKIYNKIMASFPGLHQFMIDSQNMAMELGYVDTFWGRKRRLPNMQLPQYEFILDESKSSNFDPLFDGGNEDIGLTEQEIIQYTNQLNACFGWKQKQNLIQSLKDEGITVIENTTKINDAERQCVNSRIQGSASDLTKKAIYLLGTNEQLKELGFQLLLYVHDEIIAQCPKENVVKVKELLEQDMVNAGSDLDIPLVCDTEITEGWYYPPIKLEEVQ